MNRLLVVLLVSTVFSFCKNQPKDGVVLKFNLEKGQRFEQVMGMQMHMKQPMMGQNVEMTNAITFTYLFEVVADSANWKKLSSTITRVKVNLTGMGQNMQFDTDSAVADSLGEMDMVAKLFGSLKGSKFYFSVNEKGEVGEVSGFEEMEQRMGSIIPGEPGSEKAFDEDGFRQNLQQSFAAYPPHPVKEGDSWNKDMTMKMEGMNVQSANTFTLQKLDGNTATIKITSKLSSAGETSVQGANMSMSGGSDGTVEYDLETGMPLKGNMNTNMEMKLVSQGNEVPMSMNMQTTISGKKL